MSECRANERQGERCRVGEGGNGGYLACVDAAYPPGRAVAACVVFERWRDAVAVTEVVREGGVPAPYRRGAFFQRELPLLLAVLAEVEPRPFLVIVDGYVWLDAQGTPGFGAHLFSALGGATPVVGVAKRPFLGAPAVAVVRGRSRRPLYVSAVGVAQGWAADRVAAMHGPYRLPTLVRRADRLARTAACGSASAT